MKWSEIRPGVEVYHSLFTHWGKGVVVKVRGVNCLESMFERGKMRAEVDFNGCEGNAVCLAKQLRKTPNRKKIREMVEFYKRRGVDAKEGEYGLLLPTSGNT